MPPKSLIWRSPTNFWSGSLARVLLLRTTQHTVDWVTFINKSEGPHGKDTYHRCMESGRIVSNLEQTKTWPNIQFPHLWSGFHNVHPAATLWGFKGTCGCLAYIWPVICVWVFSYSCVPWISKSSLQSRREPWQMGFKAPLSDLICTLLPPSLLPQ